MKDEICFVQFMHPGKEHASGDGGITPWNSQPKHKRKFVENWGRCLTNGQPSEELLRFWTEWEPESELITKITTRVENGPRSVCKPTYAIPASYSKLQNTDPFVFGEFYYALCQQQRTRGPTQLRNLSRGSVVLFGSCVDYKFAVDTVFVVDRWLDHHQNNLQQIRSEVSATYWDVTLAAWYKHGNKKCGPSRSGRSYRLYWGATVDNPVDGMFSYFPCMSATSSPSGFARPQISLPGRITDDLFQGAKLNKGISRDHVKELWGQVRQQVEKAGLSLGVHAQLPACRTTSLAK